MHRTDEEIYEEQERRRMAALRARRRKQRKQQIIVRCICMAALFITLVLIAVLVKRTVTSQTDSSVVTADQVKYVQESPDFVVELLTPNEYSRPQTALEEVNGIVIHYTANPGTTAEQNRSYFESLKDTGETYASSHFVIGMEGEIIQCVPCNEIAYASNDRNGDTISIECCIPDDTGKFTDATYGSLIKLVVWLMGRYDLTTDQVIRHYDVTGKDCPKYYVEHTDAWEQFKSDLIDYIDTNGIEKEKQIN